MEFSEMISNVLYTVLTAIVPVITAYIVNLIRTKTKESAVIEEAAKNEAVSNLIKDALSDVMDAVIYVNQIYTDSLKASGKFDKAAQEEAFNRAYVEAMNMISLETRKVIEQVYGSFDKWLQIKIESSVNLAKKEQGCDL